MRLTYQLVDIAVLCTGVILTIRFIVFFLALLHISATSVAFEGSLQNIWEIWAPFWTEPGVQYPLVPSLCAKLC